MTCSAFMCNRDPNCPDKYCPGRSHAIQINGGCTVEKGVPAVWTDDPAYAPDEPVYEPEEMQDFTLLLMFAVCMALLLVAALMPLIFGD